MDTPAMTSLMTPGSNPLGKPYVLGKPWRAALAALALLAASAVPLPAQADAGFDAWKRDFRAIALRGGVSAGTYDAAMDGLTPDSSVLRNASSQAEFTKPIWDYLDSAAGRANIENGQAKKREWAQWLDAIEQRYGVDQYVVLAIWGMESSYGQVLRNDKIVKPVIRSLATLAYADPARAEYGRTQLVSALKILERGDTTRERMTGSWAGAMGHTQFIPTTYQDHAVDATGDGRRDIWDTIPDALASTANYLKHSGWEAGKTWGYEGAPAHGLRLPPRRRGDRAAPRRLGAARAYPHGRPGLPPPARQGDADPARRRVWARLPDAQELQRHQAL